MCALGLNTKEIEEFYTILCRLRDVLMQDGKLYLVFDFLSMDLKKYIDSYGAGKFLELATVKSLTHQV